MKKGVRLGEEKYTPAAHIQAFPEIATPENVAELNRLRLKSLGIRQTESGRKMITALADKFLIPKRGAESWMRENTYSLCTFLYGLQGAIGRYLTIREKKILPGSKVVISLRHESPRRVLEITPGLFLRLEGMKDAQSPTDCTRI